MVATLGRGAEYGIEFDGNPPDYAEVAWIRVEELLRVSEDDDDALVWRELDVDLERAEPGWAAIPDPGIYVYVLRATWENRGEVTYGFYLDRRAN